MSCSSLFPRVRLDQKAAEHARSQARRRVLFLQERAHLFGPVYVRFVQRKPQPIETGDRNQVGRAIGDDRLVGGGRLHRAAAAAIAFNSDQADAEITGPRGQRIHNFRRQALAFGSCWRGGCWFAAGFSGPDTGRRPDQAVPVLRQLCFQRSPVNRVSPVRLYFKTDRRLLRLGRENMGGRGGDDAAAAGNGLFRQPKERARLAPGADQCDNREFIGRQAQSMMELHGKRSVSNLNPG